MADESITTIHTNRTNALPNANKIFIVHGHDSELKQCVARIIEKQGIGAMILSEQAIIWRTIIEKCIPKSTRMVLDVLPTKTKAPLSQSILASGASFDLANTPVFLDK